MRLPLRLAVFAFAIGLPMAAQARDCDNAGPQFAAGAKFAGEVRQVLDGQTLCLGRARSASTWVKVRLADLNPENPGSWGARRALSRVGLGKYAVCTAVEPAAGSSGDKALLAICRVAGVSLGLRVQNARDGKPNN